MDAQDVVEQILDVMGASRHTRCKLVLAFIPVLDVSLVI